MAKKAWLWLVVLLVTSFTLPGCSEQQRVERPPLRVEWTDWEGDYTLLVAQKKGFFEKHGVNVEPVYYATFSKAIPNLAAHQIDGGLFGLSDTLTVSQATDIKTVAISDSGGTVAVVARADIESVADLKGKKVGAVLGVYGEMFVRQMLSEAGLTAADVELFNIDPDLVPAALSDNTISAGYVWAPLHRQAVNQGHKVLYSQPAGSVSPDVVVFRADVVEARPEDIRAFLDAWFEAVEFRMQYPEESRAIIASATHRPVSYITSDPDLKIYTREDNLVYYNQDPSNENSIYAIAQENLDFKIMRGDITFPPDLEAIFDPSFLK